MAIQQTPRSLAAGAAAVNCVGFVVHLCGFLTAGCALAKLLDGLGFLSVLMLLTPFGLGLGLLGCLELLATAGLLGGGVLLLCRRGSGVWVTVGASAAGCLGQLLVAARIIPAPIVFGKVAAGMPSGELALLIGGCVVVLSGLTMALAMVLAVRAPGRVAAG